MYAKTSHHGLHFFAHAPGAPHCTLAEETVHHHLLKLELAAAARAAGAHAELEVRGPTGTWRADVLATSVNGSRQIALEAQLSPITRQDTIRRTELMREDGVSAIWFTDRQRPPWLGHVPSARVSLADEHGLLVTDALAKFSEGTWQRGPRVPVAEFLGWIFTGQVIAHRRQAPVTAPLPEWRTVWTAPRYAEGEAAHLAEAQRQLCEQRAAEQQRRTDRLRAAQERDRQRFGTDRSDDHQAAIQALMQRQAALEKPVYDFIRRATGAYPYIDEQPAPEFAMGLPVYIGQHPYGVVCPVASRIPASRTHLAPLVIFVASRREKDRIAAQTRPDQRIVVLEGPESSDGP
ncbi:competence protein CoiA family protein [Streptomyces alboflavus]|uniref:competence protein CoiA family protein n=1 Tax=Streptomyces alboflavus TaxID=67267 RepID=UPI0036D07537